MKGEAGNERGTHGGDEHLAAQEQQASDESLAPDQLHESDEKRVDALRAAGNPYAADDSQVAQNRLTCVGLMSGTSVDGIDVAVVDIAGEPPVLQVKLRHFATVPFTEEVRQRIFHLFDSERATVVDVSQMNFLLGHVFADAVMQVLTETGIDLQDVAFVASHGQTIYHHPVPQSMAGYPITSTLQIGEPSVITERTGIPTIADFRVRDMAAGGQGAPLVPFVDALLFSHPAQGRILANIGGIANLTVLPAGGETNPVAFDTGPGNMIIDGLVQRMTDEKQRFDEDGKIARSGKVDESLLQEWLALPYFSEQPPKSTGRELFGQACIDRWWEQGLARGLAPQDVVATATAYTARTFGQAVIDFILPKHEIAEIIVGGGGSYNPVLMEQIGQLLPNQRLLRQEEATGIPADAKEAVAFAVLGYECYHRRPNNLPSATGAQRPVVLGKIVWE